MRRLLLILMMCATAATPGGLACSKGQPPLAPAGHVHDEGHGELARASRTLLTADEATEPDPFADERDPRPRGTAAADGSPADGSTADGSTADGSPASGSPGGSPYGGSTYGAYDPPAWSTQPPEREPAHDQLENLAGAITGTITWRGPPPPTPPPTTRCGALPATLRLGPRNTLGGVLVFIARVQQGRILPMDNRPATVGGMVAKRGCAFLPTAQLVTPHPAPLVVHGDATSVRVRVGAREPVELQAGGRLALQAPLGITRVDATDDAHAAAWVVATESPAYAITDDRGRFRLDELAPGTYEVTIWQAPQPTVTNGALTYSTPIVAKRTVRVHGTRATRLDVTLAR